MEKRPNFTALALLLVAASFAGLAKSAEPRADAVVKFPAPPANLAGKQVGWVLHVRTIISR